MYRLKSYQREGVDWMIKRETDDSGLKDYEECPTGGILADEVGLGKTIQSITLINENPHLTLILCPKSLVKQWVSEFNKFSPDTKVGIITNDTEHISNDFVYISSISFLNKKSQGKTILHKVEWGRIIIDEAHSIKNKKSKLHKSVKELRSKHKWCLSATPVMNKMTDFIGLMNFIGIEQVHCQCYKKEVVNKFLLRRTKADVANEDISLQLPNLHINVKRMSFVSNEEKQLYKEVYERAKSDIKKTSSENIMEILEMLLRVRQICAFPECYISGMRKKLKQTDLPEWEHESSKLNTVTSEVLKYKNEKTLIFCQFIKEMDAYQSALCEMNIRSLRIDGSMDMDERQYSISEFKKNKNINILIIQINTGGQGINLQEATRIHITCPTWNPALEYQAIGRAHRTGQTKEVHVTKYILSDPEDTEITYIEEKILELHDKKKEVISDVLQDPRIKDSNTFNFNKAVKISGTDIKKLFRK